MKMLINKPLCVRIWMLCALNSKRMQMIRMEMVKESPLRSKFVSPKQNKKAFIIECTKNPNEKQSSLNK